jgi:hypothetical protein
MREGLAFEDVLNRTIGGSSTAPREAFPPVIAGTAAAYGFFLLDAGVPSTGMRAGLQRRLTDRRTELDTARTVHHLGRANASAVPMAGGDTAPPARASAADGTCGSSLPPFPRRRLSPRQQQALEMFNTLGAGLQLHFTGGDLRSAFRRLARKYHPDRHAGCSHQDRDRLAALFGHAREAYEVLSRVTPAG